MARTIRELMEEQPQRKTVLCKAWGDTPVTITRLDPKDLKQIAAATEGLQQDAAGNLVDPEEAYDFAIEVLSACIVEDGEKPFGNEAGRRWLAGEVQAVAELMPIAMQMCGLGSARPEIAEKKSG